METELRIYQIRAGSLDAFLAAWLDGVLPLRRRFGFEVEAWTDRSADQFIWLVSYSGSETFDEADARYYASPERAAVSPDPRTWIEEQQTFRLSPVDVGSAG